ncbi:predicted protein [Uncinocarpus reesii 1704]|uniref:Uncharacterized protein n=1 Tax=Uncinocarpus reesii (strain UAMH 1704) TaxID=336963 RepID=C4JPN9_UNCRE|nr:uncharacterized protein UREG_03211 [Uncinocarpus reesii 1704]EEP78365.1 predicted protein [Uncinocarpus reesii 1704]
MKILGFTLLLLQAMLVCVQATTPRNLEKFTIASGSVTHSLDPSQAHDKETRTIDEDIELDPSSLIPAIAPEDLDRGNSTNRTHARDLSKRRRSCPIGLPWFLPDYQSQKLIVDILMIQE